VLSARDGVGPLVSVRDALRADIRLH